MTNKGIRPEDVLSEKENYRIVNGVKVRKGTIGAALQNAGILASSLASQAEKAEAKKMIAELAPALVVLGIHEHVIWKNPDIQKAIETAAHALKSSADQ